MKYLFANQGFNRKARRTANARLKHERKTLTKEQRETLWKILDFPIMQPARKVRAGDTVVPA